MGKDYITEEKKKELEAELALLSGQRRKEILEVLSYAKSLGDLKENAEYHQAREDQGKNEERIKTIEHILKHSEVVSGDVAQTDTVGINATVTVRKQSDGKEMVFVIVGSEESDMTVGKVSNRSPLGGALFGKKPGDIATVETPKGTVHYEILKIN
ncbi:MAG: transcription elongation factor GreA [Candidatus Paceibacterota bacterium]